MSMRAHTQHTRTHIYIYKYTFIFIVGVSRIIIDLLVKSDVLCQNWSLKIVIGLGALKIAFNTIASPYLQDLLIYVFVLVQGMQPGALH